MLWAQQHGYDKAAAGRRRAAWMQQLVATHARGLADVINDRTLMAVEGYEAAAGLKEEWCPPLRGDADNYMVR